MIYSQLRWYHRANSLLQRLQPLRRARCVVDAPTPSYIISPGILGDLLSVVLRFARSQLIGPIRMQATYE